MKMESLNKTQIVLLTLLVSFVTSIATGIVTVTLLEQAPPGVTQTINRVVERTIEIVIPGENQVTTVVKEVIIKEEDLIANAVEKSLKSLVLITAINSEGAEVSLGLGVVISGDGYVATDKSRLFGNRNNLVVVHGDETFEADIMSGEDSEVAILKIRTSKNNPDGTGDVKIVSLTPASLSDSDSIKLGQTVVSLGGEMGDTVLTGIVSRLTKETIVIEDVEGAEGESQEEEKLSHIMTNIDMDKKSAGGPLLDTDGNILGINIVVSQDGTVAAVPINDIKKLLFSVTNAAQDEEDQKVGEEDLTKTE